MQDASTTTTGTTVPADKGGFPPFKAETFPSQLFWLTLTFVFLFLMLWRVINPRIQGTLADRRGAIAKDIATAQESRRKAEQATVAYETPLFEAREKARAINTQYREQAAADVKKATAEADATAEKATAETEARLSRIREDAKVHIAAAARDAAIDIVSRLAGEQVSPDDAAAAVRAAQES